MRHDVSPSVAQDTWQLWDTKLKTYISQTLLGRSDELPGHTSLQLQLPVRCGGFGFIFIVSMHLVLRCHNISLDDLRNHVAALPDDETDEHDVDGDNRSLTVCDDGLVIVGVPFGSAQFKRDFLHQQVEEWSRQLVCLDHLSSTQYKSLLFRWCILSKATFLMRNVSPSVAHSAWQAWDNILKTFISQKFAWWCW